MYFKVLLYILYFAAIILPESGNLSRVTFASAVEDPAAAGS